MKRVWLGLALAGLLVFSGLGFGAEAKKSVPTLKDLEGTWAFHCGGSVVIQGAVNPIYCVGTFSLDGNGNWRSRRTFSSGGVFFDNIIEGVFELDPEGDGLGWGIYTEYAVNPDGSKGDVVEDCRDRIVVISADEIHFMGVSCSDPVTNEPFPVGPAAGGTAKRQTKVSVEDLALLKKQLDLMTRRMGLLPVGK